MLKTVDNNEAIFVKYLLQIPENVQIKNEFVYKVKVVNVIMFLYMLTTLNQPTHAIHPRHAD